MLSRHLLRPYCVPGPGWALEIEITPPPHTPAASCVSLFNLLSSPERHFLPKALFTHSWVSGSRSLPPWICSFKTSIFGESISWFCCLVVCGCENIFSSENCERWRASCAGLLCPVRVTVGFPRGPRWQLLLQPLFGFTLLALTPVIAVTPGEPDQRR